MAPQQSYFRPPCPWPSRFVIIVRARAPPTVFPRIGRFKPRPATQAQSAHFARLASASTACTDPQGFSKGPAYPPKHPFQPPNLKNKPKTPPRQARHSPGKKEAYTTLPRHKTHDSPIKELLNSFPQKPQNILRREFFKVLPLYCCARGLVFPI